MCTRALRSHLALALALLLWRLVRVVLCKGILVLFQLLLRVCQQ